jgi:DNA-binding NarL/FixJ family response regulator
VFVGQEVTEPEFGSPHTVHIIQLRGMRKRLQQLLRNFVVSETDLRPKAASQFVSAPESAASVVPLTARETGILRMLARGAHTKEIAEELCISRATVKNHISHILIKLNAHTRLEAIRRAEQRGLIKANE